MKNLIVSSLSLAAAFWSTAHAATFSFTFGALRTSTHTIVSDTSLWAIIYDADSNGLLPGGLSTIGTADNLTAADAATANAAFGGKDIKEGAFGSDRILRVFEVDSAGTSAFPGGAGKTISNFTYAAEGVAEGDKWALYWFPGLTTDSPTLPASGFEIGGMFESNPSLSSGGDTGMIFPAVDVTTPKVVYVDSVTDVNSNFPQSKLTAILAIPEPTPLLLCFSALSFVALWQRRRNE